MDLPPQGKLLHTTLHTHTVIKYLNFIWCEPLALPCTAVLRPRKAEVGFSLDATRYPQPFNVEDCGHHVSAGHHEAAPSGGDYCSAQHSHTVIKYLYMTWYQPLEIPAELSLSETEAALGPSLVFLSHSTWKVEDILCMQGVVKLSP